MSKSSGEHKSKTSKVDPMVPAGPVVSWDFNQRAKPNEILHSEAVTMIWPFQGRAWDQRGTMEARSKDVVQRRQQFKVKPPNGNGSR